MQSTYNQNTQNWLEMRKNKIGASDAPVIMNVSPYSTPYRLWEEKLGLSPNTPTNTSMQRGHALEETARLELEKITGHFFLPQVKFHNSISYMMASLDGIDPEGKYIAEIKCPNREDHSIALSGQVPEKYIPQLQHQLEVCELDMVYYFSFDGTRGTLVKVFRDDKYIKKMLRNEEEFWECMQSWTAPKMTDRDYVERTDELWQTAANQWKSLDYKLKELESKEKEIRETLIAMSGARNSKGSGIKISKFVRKGNVDYASIPELEGIPLENYRKNPIECYKIALI